MRAQGRHHLYENILRLALATAAVLGSLFLSVPFADAATNVYYSVGQSSSNLMTGSPTITVSGNTATFGVAQMGNIGVGDVVVYGSPSQTAYISGKLSTDDTQWSLVTATGTTPIATTTAAVASIKHAFTSLSAALSNARGSNYMATSSLVNGLNYSGGYILNIPCYWDDATDTTAVEFPNFVTGPSNYINIYTPVSTSTEANFSQRDTGTWAYSGAYTLSAVAPVVYPTSGDYYVRITGLQISDTLTSGSQIGAINLNNVTGTGAGYIVIANNHIRGVGTGSTWPVGISKAGSDAAPTMVIVNNVIYGFNPASSSSGKRNIY